MRLLHKPIPLDAPRQPGETVYTTLQLTRLRFSAINFQKVVIGALVAFVVASGLFVSITIAEQRAKAHDLCVSSNNGRAVIKHAFANLYDGFIGASHGAPAAVDFKREQMRRLDKDLPQRVC